MSARIVVHQVHRRRLGMGDLKRGVLGPVELAGEPEQLRRARRAGVGVGKVERPVQRPGEVHRERAGLGKAGDGRQAVVGAQRRLQGREHGHVVLRGVGPVARPLAQAPSGAKFCMARGTLRIACSRISPASSGSSSATASAPIVRPPLQTWFQLCCDVCQPPFGADRPSGPAAAPVRRSPCAAPAAGPPSTGRTASRSRCRRPRSFRPCPGNAAGSSPGTWPPPPIRSKRVPRSGGRRPAGTAVPAS